MNQDIESSDEISQEEILAHIEKNKIRFDSYVIGDRMAKRVMLELIRTKRADFILLRDKEVFDWWAGVMRTARAAIERKRYQEKKYRIGLAAYNRLTPEARRILGARKPVKPKWLKE